MSFWCEGMRMRWQVLISYSDFIFQYSLSAIDNEARTSGLVLIGRTPSEQNVHMIFFDLDHSKLILGTSDQILFCDILEQSENVCVIGVG